jgi:hypothetical protein
MPFVPVRFETEMRWRGCISAIHEDSLELILTVVEGSPVGEEAVAWVLKSELPADEVAKARMGSSIECASGLHFDRFGTCRRGFEFHVLERVRQPG